MRFREMSRWTKVALSLVVLAVPVSLATVSGSDRVGENQARSITGGSAFSCRWSTSPTYGCTGACPQWNYTATATACSSNTTWQMNCGPCTGTYADFTQSCVF